MWSCALAKILVINNNIDPPYTGCTDILRSIDESGVDLKGAEIITRHAPAGEPLGKPEDYIAVFMSGSKTRILQQAPWIDNQLAFIRDLYVKKIPTLGICYGEQMIVRALAGIEHTRAADVAEFGWVKIEALPAMKHSKIFANLPQTFYSFCYHRDEVTNIPKDKFTVVLQSADCTVQAYDVIGAPMWGVQFHPERNIEGGNESLESMAKSYPHEKLWGRFDAKKLYDQKICNEIFAKFLNLALAGASRS
jgi:GMP synthase-like glutamine amidotransferase